MKSESSIYLAGPLGFSDPGRYYHERVVVPAVVAAGLRPLDPWAQAGEVFAALEGNTHRSGLVRANLVVGEANRTMIEQAQAMLAVLDGSDVDSGTAAEIGYAAAIRTPVVGLRTDIRMSGDNEATPVNLQVAYFVELSGGEISTGIEAAIAALQTLVTRPAVSQ